MTEHRAELRALFTATGCRGWVHARRLCDDTETALDADHALPMASLYKVAVAAVWADLADRSLLDPRAPQQLDPRARTDGPTGLSALADPVTMSARDLVRSMITVSDNAAADHLLGLVGGGERVTDQLHRWGLDHSVVRHGTAGALQQLRRETGARSYGEAMTALADVHHDVDSDEYDAALTSTATPRELTRLLQLVWQRDSDGFALVRDAMRGQVWPHRLRSGFPHDDVVVAGKTGTLGVLRHEVGVIEFPHEEPIAVAVLTRAARPERHLPTVDHVIGAAAAAAVRPLRRVRGSR